MAAEKLIRIGAYADDPPALDSFRSFDPESYLGISMLYDSLVYTNTENVISPSLAVSWHREGELAIVFELRQGVTFHNGDSFDADDVVATLAAHLDPDDPSVLGMGLFAIIKSCEKLGPYRVRFETHAPDGMLLSRFIFSHIYPKALLKVHGRQYFYTQPVGTGAYQMDSWKPGEVIRLRRFDHHWAGAVDADYLELPIMRHSEWLDGLKGGTLDAALSVDVHDVHRAQSIEGLNNVSREAAIPHLFLLAKKGPLAHEKVRQALNYAVHGGLLVDIAERGLGTAQASMLTEEQIGHNPELSPYIYDPDVARGLLKEAGYSEGFEIKGLVASNSSAIYLAAKEFLARIGVQLQAEIVPRSEWMRRIVNERMAPGEEFPGDFAVLSCDNPTGDGLFHHYCFLFSQGPLSIYRDQEYDQLFLIAAGQVEPQAYTEAMQRLEKHVQESAPMLFTVKQQLHVICREGVSIPLSKTGHFDNEVFWKLKKEEYSPKTSNLTPLQSTGTELDSLLEATGYTGLFYRSGDSFEDQCLERLWRNLVSSQDRWFAQIEPMMRILVSQAEAKTHLSNVLSSTSRVAIVGYSKSGRESFVNEGYRRLLGTQQCLETIPVHGSSIDSWNDVRQRVDEEGAWHGPVTLTTESQVLHLYLMAAASLDEFENPNGYTYVFSDFSGEEERIRSGAIRRIMDNIPYGLCTCDLEGRVLEGYSKACDDFFSKVGQAIQGEKITELLGLDSRSADDFISRYDQIFFDVLPEEVTLSMLPERISAHGKTLALSGSVIRDDEGQVFGVLFSFVDVTALEKAEAEVLRIRATMAVLQEKERFSEVCSSFLEALDALIGLEPQSDSFESQARRELHNYKGTFGLFEQTELVSHIHRAEDHAKIRHQDLLDLRQVFLKLLKDNHSIWQIAPGVRHPIQIQPEELLEFYAQIEHAEDLVGCRDIAQRFATEHFKKPVFQLIGPIRETCMRISKRQEKLVRLEIDGEDLRVPPAHGPLYRALTHLLRNSVDHGIEHPHLRGEKNREALIKLSLSREPEGYRILFEDDGRGIQLSEVVRQAVESGLVSQKDVETMSESEQLALVFASGLSTATQVTELSGRGVGMEALKEIVDTFAGDIELSSVPGQGTRVIITIPEIPAKQLLPLS